MSLPAPQTVAYVVAAYLHDLGKAGTYHLTALNVAEYDGHRAAAQKVFNVPDRFLQAVGLHADSKSALNSMYERFDGRGFPLGVGNKDIPLGGRILAVVDSYADLTMNTRNPIPRSRSFLSCA
jgi:response regulator RpfG family c-di-GMP phosphodiesterase